MKLQLPDWLKLSGGAKPKAPELKVPTFLADLWWDLWDRRLLPLVALIAVAIVAVPFLMGGKSQEVPQSSLAALAAAGGVAPAGASPAADLTVVEAKPGLRDYHERLGRLKPTDPFVQRFAEPRITAHLGESGSGGGGSTTTTTTTVSGGEGGGEIGSSGSSEPSPSPPSSPEPPQGESGGGESGGAPSTGGGRTTPHLIFYAFAIDVRITRSDGTQAEGEAAQKPQASVKKRVLPLTPLPGEKAPVVTYMGPSAQGKALLLVSNDVRSIKGEGSCALGKVSGEISPEAVGEGACQLLEVEPGFPDTFVYGASEARYTIKVLKIEAVVVKRT